MTQLSANSRTVRRETAATVWDGGKLRHIVVTLHAGFLLLRLKGRREAVSLGYESAYRVALEQERESRRAAAKRPKGALA